MSATDSLYLQPDVEIVVQNRNPLLRRKQGTVSHVLGVAEAMTLLCLADTGDVEATIALCAEALPDGAAWARRTIHRYWTYLGNGSPRPLSDDIVVSLQDAVPSFPLLPMSNVKQEAAPVSVTWVVTLECNRRCPYCFFQVKHHPLEPHYSPADATFPLADVQRMIREMAEIGAADFYLTGGEPFLREDLSEVIACATSQRVRTHVVTKYPLTKRLAHRLATAGITTVTVSLDDSRDVQANALAGSPTYLNEAVHSIRALLEAGVNCDVNAVVTRINYPHLEEFAGFLQGLGVPRLKLSLFRRPFPYKAPTDKLAVNIQLDDDISRLNKIYRASGMEILSGESAAGVEGKKCSSSFLCEIGTQSIAVLPDGSASRCRYLPHEPVMIVGNLREQSLVEIWNSEVLRSTIRPSRSQYQGTECADCQQFDGCNSRGRCYLSSLQCAGHLFAPDAKCAKPKSDARAI